MRAAQTAEPARSESSPHLPLPQSAPRALSSLVTRHCARRALSSLVLPHPQRPVREASRERKTSEKANVFHVLTSGRALYRIVPPTQRAGEERKSSRGVAEPQRARGGEISTKEQKGHVGWPVPFLLQPNEHNAVMGRAKPAQRSCQVKTLRFPMRKEVGRAVPARRCPSCRRTAPGMCGRMFSQIPAEWHPHPP